MFVNSVGVYIFLSKYEFLVGWVKNAMIIRKEIIFGIKVLNKIYFFLDNIYSCVKVRLGRRPIYVDLDVGQGNISVPGSLGQYQPAGDKP